MKKEVITAHVRTHTLTLNGINRNLTIPYIETLRYISDTRQQEGKVHRGP